MTSLSPPLVGTSLRLVLLFGVVTGSAACALQTGVGALPSSMNEAAPQRGEVDPALVGCWETYNYKDDRTAADSYRSRLRLDEDGGFEWLVYPWGSSAGQGLESFEEAGAWGVDSGSLGLFPEGERPTSLAISNENGALHLNGQKQFTCM